MDIDSPKIPEFKTIGDFLLWWESAEVLRYRASDPASSEAISAHPAVAKWLAAMRQTIVTSAPGIGGSLNLAPGDVFGRYTIREAIGMGGMGAVYRAIDGRNGVEVALKVLLMSDSDAVERFRREAASASKLDHPNIVKLLDHGEVAGRHYFAMQYVSGVSLDHLIKTAAGRLDPVWIAEVMATVADAVACAHGQNLIHRDIKPSNILIAEDSTVYLTDFGIAKETGQSDLMTLTQSGAILGTPHFMSPEQALGQKRLIDHRSDIFSLGATLYDAVAGRPPFESEELYMVLDKIVKDDPAPLTQTVVGVPSQLETICMKCLDKSQVKRYQTAAELRDDLDRFAAGERIKARPKGFITKVYEKASRNKGVAAAIFGAVALAVVISVVGYLSYRRSVESSELAASAEKHFNAGEYELALKEAEKALAISKSNEDAESLRAKTLDRMEHARSKSEQAAQVRAKAKGALDRTVTMKKTEDKLEAVLEALEIDPSYGQAHQALGFIYKEQREYNKAFDSFSRAIECDPGLAYSYYERGTLDEYVMSTGVFESDYAKVIELDPGSYLGYVCQGRVFNSKGQDDKAMEMFKKAIEIEPEDSEAYGYRMYMYKNKGQFQEAVADADKVKPEHPAYANAMSVKFESLIKSAKYKEALELYDKWRDILANKPLARYFAGIAYRGTGDVESAMEEFSYVIGMKFIQPSGHAEAKAYLAELNNYKFNSHQQRGLIFIARLDYQSAIDDFTKAIAIWPQNSPTYVNRGWAYMEISRHTAALEDFKKGVEADPKNEKAWIGMGCALGSLLRFEESVKAFDEAGKLAPGVAEVYAQRAKVLVLLKRYDEAMKDFTRTIELMPSLSDAYVGRARIFLMRMDLSSALKDIDAAIAIGDKSMDVFEHKGGIHLLMNEPVEAAKAFELCLEIDPGAMAVREKLVTAYSKLDMKESVLAQYDGILGYEPSNIRYRQQRYSMLMSMGRFADALKDAEYLVSLEPDNSDFILYEAASYGGLKQFDKAFERYDAVLVKDPGNEMVYFNRGLDLLILDEYSKALDDFNKAVALKPDYHKAYLNRSYAEFNLGMNEEALADAGMAYDNMKAVRDRDSAVSHLGNIRYRMKEYAKAIGHYEESLKLAPGNSEALGRIAMCHIQLGDLVKAGEMLKQAKAAPATAATLAAEGMMERANGRHKEAVDLLKAAVAANGRYGDDLRPFIDDSMSRIGGK